MAIDTNYFVKPGENMDAYNKRVAEYNATKEAGNAGNAAAVPSPAPVANPTGNPAGAAPAATSLPVPAATPEASPITSKPYTVQSGDTLSAIAAKFGVPVASISGYRSGDPNKIYPGETLSVGTGIQGSGGAKGVGDATGQDDLGKAYMDAMMESMLGGGFGSDTTQTPDVLSQFGLHGDAISQGFQTNPAQTINDLVQQVMKATQLPDAKSAIDELAKQIEDVSNERDTALQEIDDNPFLSAGTKEQRKQQLNDKYELRIKNRQTRLQLIQGAYDDARQQAQFAATTALNLYDKNRNFDQGRLEFAMAQAEKHLQSIQDMQKLNPAEFKEVNGGLYNIRTNSWVIPPKPAASDLTLGGLSKDQRTYLNTIQDNARQDPNIKEFPTIRASFETARSAVQRGGGAGDIVLMRMLAKITDPTTGVKEEEFRTFEGAQSTLARYGIKLTKQMWAGDRLTDNGRLQLYQQAKDIYGQRLDAYENSVNFFDRQATDGGIKPGSVMPSYKAPEEKSTTSSGAGSTFKSPSGKTYNLPY